MSIADGKSRVEREADGKRDERVARDVEGNYMCVF